MSLPRLPSSAELIVTRHELEGSHQIVDEQVLLEEEGAGDRRYALGSSFDF